MSTSYILPDTAAIASLLEMIFGEGVGVTDQGTPDLSGKHLATFLNDEDELVAVCAGDKPFVAYSGAALSMIPADVANEMVDGAITDTVADNFHEVMNIFSKLMMSETSAHLRLEKILQPDQTSGPISALEGTATPLAFDIDIPKYGKGNLALLIA